MIFTSAHYLIRFGIFLCHYKFKFMQEKKTFLIVCGWKEGLIFFSLLLLHLLCCSFLFPSLLLLSPLSSLLWFLTAVYRGSNIFIILTILPRLRSHYVPHHWYRCWVARPSISSHAGTGYSEEQKIKRHIYKFIEHFNHNSFLHNSYPQIMIIMFIISCYIKWYTSTLTWYLLGSLS